MFQFYLNTSHVKVNQKALYGVTVAVANLNTSHVKVNPAAQKLVSQAKTFKYISC